MQGMQQRPHSPLACLKVNERLSGHFMSDVTRIQRFPLVVPPVVKLGIEGPALLLPEAPPGGRTFLQGRERLQGVKRMSMSRSVLRYVIQMCSF